MTSRGAPHDPSPRFSVLPIVRRRSPLVPTLGLAVLGLLATSASRAWAQDTPSVEESVTAVRPGEIVRVRLRGGAAWEGDFAGTRAGRILLAGGRDTLALASADVSALWARERRTRMGARRGALLGGGVGLAISGFFAVVLSAMGSSDGTGDSTMDDAVGLVVAGTALGAGTGAALGGSVGAASTGWRQVVPADRDIRAAVPRVVSRVGGAAAEVAAEPGTAPSPSPDGVRAGTVPTRRRFGALDGALSYGRLAGSGGSSGGVGARLAVLAELRYGGETGGTRRLVAFGPEVELQGVGKARQSFQTDSVGEPFTAAAVRAVVRLGPETDRMRAYALLGAGVHGWRTEGLYGANWYTHPAGVAGAGVQVRPGAGPLSVGLEGRLNRIVLSGDDYPPSYWTAALTFNTAR